MERNSEIEGQVRSLRSLPAIHPLIKFDKIETRPVPIEWRARRVASFETTPRTRLAHPPSAICKVK